MPKRIAIIVFSGDLDKVIAAFNIAIGAASTGIDTTMYFTFWGMNVLKKEGPLIKGKGTKRKLLNLMNRGGAHRLPLSKLNMLGIGSWMMRQLMRESNVPSIEEMIKLAKKQGVKLIACSPTMEMMGTKKEDLIEEVDEVAGVATYLSKATESNVNLFI